MYSELKQIIEQAWEERALLSEESVREAVRRTVDLVDKGQLRTAEPLDEERSLWQVNEWVKKAVILYFPLQPMRKMQAGELEWYDKMELKHGYEELGVRACPRRGALRCLHRPGRHSDALVRQHRRLCRYGHNGRYVGHGGLLCTNRQAGPSVGRRGHRRCAGARAGGAGHHRGPLLHRFALDCGRGAHVCREAVLGSNTVITGSTHIIDVTGPEPVTYKGYVPPRSVVVPGSYRKQFPAGEYSVSCALIIGRRKESTDKKTSLNDALRDFGVSA